jgi:hypothetical protein
MPEPIQMGSGIFCVLCLRVIVVSYGIFFHNLCSKTLDGPLAARHSEKRAGLQANSHQTIGCCRRGLNRVEPQGVVLNPLLKRVSQMKNANFLFFSFLICSCGVFDATENDQRRIKISEHTIEDDKSMFALSAPSSLRTMIAKTHGGVVRFCAEPPPDTGVSSNSSANVNVAASLASITSLSQKMEVENKILRDKMYELVTKLEAERESTGKSSDDLEYYRKVLSDMSASQNVSGNLTLGVATQQALNIVELGGRNDELLLAREFLYRICEASYNDPNTITGSTVVKLQTNAMAFLIKRQEAKKASLVVEVARYSSDLYRSSYDAFRLQSENCLKVQTQCVNDYSELLKSADVNIKAKATTASLECTNSYSSCMDKANSSIQSIGNYVSKQHIAGGYMSVDDRVKLRNEMIYGCNQIHGCCMSQVGAHPNMSNCQLICKGLPPVGGICGSKPADGKSDQCDAEIVLCIGRANDIFMSQE